MGNVKQSKSLFMFIGGRKVYKICNYNGLFYQIARVEPQITVEHCKNRSWCPQFVIYEISEEEYLYLLYRMETSNYRPYLNRYNERVVRYLARNYFRYPGMAINGFDLYQLIKKAKTDHRFLESLRLEED